jgi:hypothetical protein
MAGEDGTLDLRSEEWFQLVDPRALRDSRARALNRVWRTKEGGDLRYDQIDSAHLVNILLLLRRKSQETAQHAASKVHLLLGPTGWRLRKHPAWDGLIEEAKRRGPKMIAVADLLEAATPPAEAIIRAAIPRS